MGADALVLVSGTFVALGAVALFFRAGGIADSHEGSGRRRFLRPAMSAALRVVCLFVLDAGFFWGIALHIGLFLGIGAHAAWGSHKPEEARLRKLAEDERPCEERLRAGAPDWRNLPERPRSGTPEGGPVPWPEDPAHRQKPPGR